MSANIAMSLDDLIKKDKPVKKEGGGSVALAGNRGGRGGLRGGRGGGRPDRPRFNENKGARNDLFRARKGANAIQKRDRGQGQQQQKVRTIFYDMLYLFVSLYD